MSAWPVYADLEAFLRLPGAAATDQALTESLDAAVSYGKLTLGEGFETDVPDHVRTGCLDYAGSLYMERVGGSDQFTDAVQGSTPQQRFRRLLLASRMPGFA
jgi:hypothetical protein